MPDQGGYFGGNGGYQRQPANGGYNGNVGNFPINNPTQTAQTAQAAYSRRAGAFPYSRPNGFVNGSAAYDNGVYGNSMNGNGVGQPAPNMNFPTNSGIRQFQQSQGFSGNMQQYNGVGGNNGIPPEAIGRNNSQNSPFRTESRNAGSRRVRQNGNRNSPFINNFPEPSAEPENIPEPQLSDPEEINEKNDSKKSSLLSLLDGVKIDPEKATLVLLIVILARNDADITLIMALAYLLM
ncbi:MAG: hypothetical protein K2K57_13315 [Oscillospiraceae bacterium]|nr:hypothetical protein [Oscillospiraceae bacterium]